MARSCVVSAFVIWVNVSYGISGESVPRKMVGVWGACCQIRVILSPRSPCPCGICVNSFGG